MLSLKQWSVLAASLVGCSSSSALAAEGAWQHTVILYGMGAAIDGDAQIGDLKVPVDLSISDVFDALEFGAMGAYRADNGTWSVTVDATFMGLGGSSRTEGGLVKGDVDMDQTTLMGTVGRRWTDNLEFLFSLAYVDLSTDLTVATTAPITGVVTTRNASKDASWVDPLLGLQYSVPIADDWRFTLRGDVGGFGIGSDLTYQVLTGFRWQANETVGAVLGYRLIAFDYEDGQGQNYQRYDLLEQGPMAGITISF